MTIINLPVGKKSSHYCTSTFNSGKHEKTVLDILLNEICATPYYEDLKKELL